MTGSIKSGILLPKEFILFYFKLDSETQYPCLVKSFLPRIKCAKSTKYKKKRTELFFIRKFIIK